MKRLLEILMADGRREFYCVAFNHCAVGLL
jgi:hypothetical protein